MFQERARNFRRKLFRAKTPRGRRSWTDRRDKEEEPERTEGEARWIFRVRVGAGWRMIAEKKSACSATWRGRGVGVRQINNASPLRTNYGFTNLWQPARRVQVAGPCARRFPCPRAAAPAISPFFFRDTPILKASDNRNLSHRPNCFFENLYSLSPLHSFVDASFYHRMSLIILSHTVYF